VAQRDTSGRPPGQTARHIKESSIPLIATDAVTMSDRQLGSSITDPRTGNKRQLSFDGLPLSGNSTPKKRRKVEYRCVHCGQNKPSRSFPRTNPSPQYIHDINTCKECLQAWVDTQIRDGLLVLDARENPSYGLRCPECSELIQATDVQAIATPEMY
jgi:hypothetical protein